MMKVFKKFKNDMSNTDFINQIVYLDTIDNSNLSEFEEDQLSDFYNNLYKICPNLIDANINNKTPLINRGETIGEFMNFLKYINL